MALSKAAVGELYERRARHYDWALWLYVVTGFRAKHYRREAVKSLLLKPGDTVVDLACGTGLNFPFVEERVGEAGRIIGVDLTQAMLERARERVKACEWRNVELVQADLASYEFPPQASAIISTLAITLIPEYAAVIRRGANALRPGGRMAILDLKRPEHWPEWLVRFGAWLYRPFAVSVDLADRRPRESLRRHLREVLYREYYVGGVYLSVGEAPIGSSAPRLCGGSDHGPSGPSAHADGGGRMRHYLLFYDLCEDFVQRRVALRSAHLEKAWQSSARGELVLGGALDDPVDAAVLLFRANSPHVAEAFAKADPYVANGLVSRWRVREWMTVAGEGAASPIRPARATPEEP